LWVRRGGPGAGFVRRDQRIAVGVGRDGFAEAVQQRRRDIEDGGSVEVDPARDVRPPGEEDALGPVGRRERARVRERVRLQCRVDVVAVGRRDDEVRRAVVAGEQVLAVVDLEDGPSGRRVFEPREQSPDAGFDPVALVGRNRAVREAFGVVDIDAAEAVEERLRVAVVDVEPRVGPGDARRHRVDDRIRDRPGDGAFRDADAVQRGQDALLGDAHCRERTAGAAVLGLGEEVRVRQHPVRVDDPICGAEPVVGHHVQRRVALLAVVHHVADDRVELAVVVAQHRFVPQQVLQAVGRGEHEEEQSPVRRLGEEVEQVVAGRHEVREVRPELGWTALVLAPVETDPVVRNLPLDPIGQRRGVRGLGVESRCHHARDHLPVDGRCGVGHRDVPDDRGGQQVPQ